MNKTLIFIINKANVGIFLHQSNTNNANKIVGMVITSSLYDITSQVWIFYQLSESVK